MVGSSVAPTDTLPVVLYDAKATQRSLDMIKIGAKVTSHGRYATFQMAEVAVSRQMFNEILSLIAGLRAPPAPA